MPMSKQHYVAIADVFAHAKLKAPLNTPAEDAAERMRQHLARELADALKRDNIRFDRVRFLEACGVAL